MTAPKKSKNRNHRKHNGTIPGFVLDATAQSASKTLHRVRQTLLIAEDGLSKVAKKRAVAYLRIPSEAIALGINVVEAQPGRFPDFDVAGAKQALAHEAAMAPVAQQCRDMAARIDEDIVAAKAKAAQQTLALYGSMKAVSRLNQGETMLSQIRQMSVLVRTHGKHRAAASTSPAPGTTSATQPSAVAPATTTETTQPAAAASPATTAAPPNAASPKQ